MRVFRLFLSLCILLIVVEIALRFIWGFGNPVLFKESSAYEYIYAPSQNVKRYGNRIITNSYGMRSGEPKGGKSLKVLYLGDSVINGGMHTSQEELASTKLEKILTEALTRDVQVLNISAGSWGPDNAAAFINEHGTFDAGAMVLVFSSHDAFDNMNFEPVVNRNVNYPGKKPLFAISEVFLRYVLPASGNILGMADYGKDKLMINNQRAVFNSGWNDLIVKAQRDSIPLYVVLHAEQQELSQQRLNRYGLRIIDTLQAHNVPYATDLEWGITPDCYRDFIHLNAKGQNFLAEKLSVQLFRIIETSASKTPLN